MSPLPDRGMNVGTCRIGKKTGDLSTFNKDGRIMSREAGRRGPRENLTRYMMNVGRTGMERKEVDSLFPKWGGGSAKPETEARTGCYPNKTVGGINERRKERKHISPGGGRGKRGRRLARCGLKPEGASIEGQKKGRARQLEKD